MKKPRNYTVGLYIVLLVLIFGFGYFMIKYGSENLVANNVAFFYVVVFLISFILTGIIFEVGHLIGAKIAGYDVVACNIFGFTIGRVNGEVKFTYEEKYHGMLGETVVTPKKEGANPKWIYINGVLSVVLVNAILFACVFLIPDLKTNASQFYYGVIGGSTVSLLFALYSLLPLSSDSTNDGLGLKYTKGEKAQLFNEYCKVVASIKDGNKLEPLSLMSEINPLISGYNFYACNSQLYAGNYEEAGRIADYLIANSENVSVVLFDNIVPLKLTVLANTMSKEEFVDYYSNSVENSFKTSMSKLDTIEKCRAMLLISGLMLDNETAVSNTLRKYSNLLEKEKNKGVHDQEKELADSYLNKIIELHPEWNVNW